VFIHGHITQTSSEREKEKGYEKEEKRKDFYFVGQIRREGGR